MDGFGVPLERPGALIGSALQELAHEEAQIVYVDWLVEDRHCPGQQSTPV